MAGALFGYSIDTDFPLSRARAADDPRGVLQIRRADVDLLACQGELVSWDDRDGVQFALATSGGDLLAWCSLTGSYLIRSAAGCILSAPIGPAPQWEHRIGATILPLLLSECGDLSLHAAAVATGDGTVLLCGPAGRGKSTLTAALALGGHAVLSDDGVVISELDSDPVAWPGQAGVRLPRCVLAVLETRSGVAIDAAAEKSTLLVASDGRPMRPLPISAAVLLAPREGSQLEVEQLDPIAALPALMPHVLYGGPDRLATAMSRVALLLERAPVFRARLPDDLANVGDSADALLHRVGVAGADGRLPAWRGARAQTH